jgi:hypothetical protein
MILCLPDFWMSALAGNRTQSTIFAESRANPAHSEDESRVFEGN